MRGLYWLTAITLVAAAVTTVAIADYSRRHSGKASAFAASSITKPVATLLAPPPPQPTLSACATQCEPTPAPCPAQTCQTQNCPTAIKVEDVPEHQQLKEQTFNGLAMMKEGPVDKQAFGGFAEARPAAPAEDEFSFPGKNTPAKTAEPPIPGYQPPTPSPVAPNAAPTFQKVAEFAPSSIKAGPEVLPGLHAVKTEADCDANPVSDCLAACAEFVAMVSPPTYLVALPAKPAKCDDPVKSAWIPGASAATITSATCLQEKKDCNAKMNAELAQSEELRQAREEWRKYWDEQASKMKPGERVHGGFTDSCTVSKSATCQDNSSKCCSANCCKVVVRTYPIADFTGTSCNNHQELIQLITRMIAPDSWETKDSTIAYFPQGQCLVIRHQAAVTEQVDDLLRQLRGAMEKQGTLRAKLPTPVIRIEPTRFMPGGCEAVPMPPMCRPRIITNEPTYVADDEFFGMIPMNQDGKLMPIPTRADVNPLLPATFLPGFEDGPAARAMEKRVPDFFPLTLPYAPLPAAPVTCEEEMIRTVELQKSATEGPAKPASPKK